VAQPDEQIAVIGGGVVGITTATLLQANGYPTLLYALARPDDFGERAPAAFASLHAAASILPHSVASPHSTRWVTASQEFFGALALQAGSGVRTQRHYEIFEAGNLTPPAYHSAVPEFEMLAELDLSMRQAPIRPGATSVSGWCYSAFFCEAPRYLRFLYWLYQAIGGEVAPATELPEPPSLSNYLARDHEIYVVCAGCASGELLEDAIGSGRYEDRPLEGAFEPLLDPFGVRLIRGHYLALDAHATLCDRDARSFSYNYTPTSEIYPTSSGSAADVYCYPRTIGWLLGGSRQVGRVDEKEEWSGETSACEEIAFPGAEGTVLVPAPIFDLNRELLAVTAGTDVALDRLRHATPPRIRAGIGYRFARDNDHDNVRVGISRVVGNGEKIIATNYGHGGAGYTLSWGSALDVLASIDRVAGRDRDPGHGHEPHDLTRAAIAAASDRLLDLS
jgi:D-amino-acid oxidase